MILAIDIGTSSVRAAIYNDKAEPLPRLVVKTEHTFEHTPDGGSEIDADVLLAKVIAAIDAILKKNTKGEIDHVAMCSIWHSLVGIDARSRPTTKVLGWADTRSRQHSTQLKDRFDEHAVHARTGAHFHSSFWPARLLWLRRESPEIWKRTLAWLSFSDYVALKLFGDARTTVSMASASGIFDQERCDWDRELLKYLRLSRSQLPSIIDSDDETLRLNSKFAKRWPQLARAKWFPAIGDGAADHLGSCGAEKGRASLMIGTSAAMRVAYTGEPPKKIPNGLWCYRIDRKRVIIGGALSDGGNLFQLIKQRFKLPSNTDELLRKRGAASDDLIVLPFFFGERSTGYNEDARGAIIGLTGAHDGIDVLYAAMEGVAFRLAEIYTRLKTVARIDEIVASGGALRESKVWTQIVANVLASDLIVTDSVENSSRGAVLRALESLGKIDCK